jgi:hypothetical protein
MTPALQVRRYVFPETRVTPFGLEARVPFPVPESVKFEAVRTPVPMDSLKVTSMVRPDSTEIEETVGAVVSLVMETGEDVLAFPAAST